VSEDRRVTVILLTAVAYTVLLERKVVGAFRIAGTQPRLAPSDCCSHWLTV